VARLKPPCGGLTVDSNLSAPGRTVPDRPSAVPPSVSGFSLHPLTPCLTQRSATPTMPLSSPDDPTPQHEPRHQLSHKGQSGGRDPSSQFGLRKIPPPQLSVNRIRFGTNLLELFPPPPRILLKPEIFAPPSLPRK